MSSLNPASFEWASPSFETLDAVNKRFRLSVEASSQPQLDSEIPFILPPLAHRSVEFSKERKLTFRQNDSANSTGPKASHSAEVSTNSQQTLLEAIYQANQSSFAILLNSPSVSPDTTLQNVPSLAFPSQQPAPPQAQGPSAAPDLIVVSALAAQQPQARAKKRKPAIPSWVSSHRVSDRSFQFQPPLSHAELRRIRDIFYEYRHQHLMPTQQLEKHLKVVYGFAEGKLTQWPNPVLPGVRRIRGKLQDPKVLDQIKAQVPRLALEKDQLERIKIESRKQQ